MWYAAHLIMALKFQDGRQDIHPVWENIHIIEADTSDEAYDKADRIGLFEQEADTGKHTYGERPVRWKYAGVRRLAECIAFEDGPPQSEREVTYLSYFLKDEKSFDRLLSDLSTEIILDGEDLN